jgi:TetR/AcrR family tetracycline transcriptional repressor
MVPCTTYSCQVTSLDERTKLTRDAVVDRALALADASGLDKLTIRKLATELGVTPMALYWHFRGKEELLEGLAERIWTEVDLTVDRSAPWPDQVRRLLESLLAVLRAHSSAPAVLVRCEKWEVESAMDAVETALDVLRTAGFSPQDASAITKSALWTSITLVMSEPGADYLDPAERAEALRQKQVRMATLPVAKYPRVVESAGPMSAYLDPEMHYRFGVEMFMAGVTALAAVRAASTDPATPAG